MQAIPLSMIETLLDGQIDIRRRPGSIQPMRLPVAELPFYDGFTQWVASCATGCRLRVSTDSTSVKLTATQHLMALPNDGERRGAYDLYVDGAFFARAWGEGGAKMNPQGGLTGDAALTLAFEGLPAGDKTVELWLPQAATVAITGLELEAGASLKAVPDGRPRVLFHGSSISHGMEAEGATANWPAVASRLANLDHLNLGWAGSCLLSGLAARIIRDQRADAIVLKLGINVHTDGQLKERNFLDAAHSMISIIREKHSTTPMLIVSPIWSPPRETAGDGPSLQRMRQLLQMVVDARIKTGDGAIGYLDGLELFGPADAALLPDDLHPNTEGYRLMGERFHRLVLSGENGLVRA
ncbi:MAG: SGNH/GDSL hydrolase family protein [Phenylobacterium sp.]|uniref:GDSL-type esterase/lipase family protein n=1 Tax=Phenylobacterium sp. TaxID=1871053 RepID=UPI00273162B6|nr:GDSL-type esterase/lipase family protein [Phenylobacterium sp.]MDP2011916.1 SGNH/GDSL hydrolase family protein [Phenylobacterium sp.]